MKHPKWRVRSIHLVAPEVLDELETALDEVVALFPNRDLIVDYEVTGSYARGEAQLHSDLDICLALSAENQVEESARRLQAQIAESRRALRHKEEIRRRLGLVRFDLSFEHWSVKSIPFKQVYSLKERKFYNRDMAKRNLVFHKKTRDGWVQYVKPTGIYRKPGPGSDPLPDPWESEIETWAQRYGKDYQHFGSTEDTSWFQNENLHNRANR